MRTSWMIVGVFVGCAPPETKDQPAAGGPEDSGTPTDDCPEGEQTWFADVDGDGFGSSSTAVGGCVAPAPGFVLVSGDCDDDDAAIHPGAAEIWYDGTDQDCGGGSDYDADGDTYDTTFEGAGHDCDDANPAVNPGAAEYWYDGVDQDCDGASDYDADGDGHDSDAHGGDDCDDFEAAVYQGAPEVLGDGLESSCGDGLHEHVGTDVATAVLYSDEPGDNAGWRLAAGDLNADGIDDLVVGVPGFHANGAGGMDPVRGHVAVVYGPISGERDLAESGATLQGFALHDGFGARLDVFEDVDGAGTPAVVVAAYDGNQFEPDGGAVYLYRGTLSGTLGADSADATIRPSASFDYLGESLATLDAEVGGKGELLVGAYRFDGGAEDGGGLWWFRDVDALSGTVTLADADLAVVGGDRHARVGWVSAFAGDVDGDGLGDVLVSGPYDGSTGGDRGLVHLVTGDHTGTLSTLDSDRRWEGVTGDDNLGQGLAAAGDWDADGYADVWITAKNDDTNGYGSGGAWLILGAADAGTMANHESYDSEAGIVIEAEAYVIGQDGEDRLGSFVHAPGDIDHDGHPDIVFAAHRADWPSGTTAGGPGAVYVIYGPFSGTVDLNEVLDPSMGGAVPAGGRISGGVDGDYFGAAITSGDFDGDGWSELAVAAVDEESRQVEAGAVFLFGNTLRR